MTTLYADTTGKLLAEYREVSEAILSRTEPYSKRSDQAENVAEVVRLLRRQSAILRELLGVDSKPLTDCKIAVTYKEDV